MLQRLRPPRLPRLPQLQQQPPPKLRLQRWLCLRVWEPVLASALMSQSTQRDRTR